jgi:TM2 domain-containing membrane protein YozV
MHFSIFIQNKYNMYHDKTKSQKHTLRWVYLILQSLLSMSEAQPGSDEQYCNRCGEVIETQAEICPECGVRRAEEPNSEGSTKHKNTAGIPALLLGGFWAHHFYLGNTGRIIIYLEFVCTLIPTIAGFVEDILYITKIKKSQQKICGIKSESNVI